MKEHLEIDLKSLLQDNDFKLLCCCSRRVLTSEDQQTITKLIQDNPNWNRFIDLAKRHRVVSLVHWNLRQVREIKIPEAVLTFFKNHAHKQVTHNLQATTSLLKILSRFQEHSIPVLPFKGPVLASILYNDVGLRYFGDLDILVNPATLNKACMTLKDMGYELVKPQTPLNASQMQLYSWTYKDCMFRHPVTRIKVELHWRLDHNLFIQPVAPNQLWEQVYSIKLAGQPISTLGVENLLSYLCFHAAKHVWGRLFWICDIAELVRTQGDLDWGQLMQQNESQQNTTNLASGLYLAKHLMGAMLPQHVEAWSQRQKVVPSLLTKAYRMLSLTEAEFTDQFRDVKPLHEILIDLRYEWTKNRNWKAKLWSLVRAVFLPKDIDLEKIQLPERLTTLYCFLVPIHTGWRLVIRPFLKKTATVV